MITPPPPPHFGNWYQVFSLCHHYGAILCVKGVKSDNIFGNSDFVSNMNSEKKIYIADIIFGDQGGDGQQPSTSDNASGNVRNPSSAFLDSVTHAPSSDSPWNDSLMEKAEAFFCDMEGEEETQKPRANSKGRGAASSGCSRWTDKEETSFSKVSEKETSPQCQRVQARYAKKQSQ